MKALKLLLIVMLVSVSLPSMAQELKGVILKNGKPQKNVSVWMKVGRSSALTDKAGQFVLSNVMPDDTLQISVSSKYDAKFLVGTLKDVTITLDKESFVLNDGTQEIQLPYSPVPQLKRGGAITHDVIMRAGLKSVSDVIRRFVPGAQEASSLTGEKVLSIARGQNSMRGPEPPLYVVDGVPYEVSSPNDIVTVEDIAELSVDRDGSAWGSRGANGVVIIKTIGGNAK